MEKVKQINIQIDKWVIKTFDPILQKHGYTKMDYIRKISIAWMILFYGSGIILWLSMLIGYIKAGQMPANAINSTWAQIDLCIVGLIGYYGYIFTDRTLWDEDIKRNK